MSIPLLPPQTLSSLEPQGFSGFEEPVGTKNQENKKCPSNWNKLANSARHCSPLNSAQKDEETPRLVLSDIVECNILAIMLYLFSPL